MYVCKHNVLLVIRMVHCIICIVPYRDFGRIVPWNVGWLLVGVQVSPTSERRVHYCSALNLFVVYRRRAAKWYPILWYPYVVYRTSVRRGGGDPLANATHVVTSCRPLSSRRNPSALLSRDFGWWEMSTERASWGALIAYHLTLSGQDLSLTACGLRHPAAGSRRDV